MDIFKQRLPDRREAIQLFIICAFIVNVWSIFNLLRVFPSFLLRFKTSEIIYIMSYTQSFALLESVGVWLILIVLGFLLPRRLLSDRFAAKGTIIIIMSSLWAIVFHYVFEISIILNNSFTHLFQTLSWSLTEFQIFSIAFYTFVIVWISLYLLGMIWGLNRINKRKQFQERIYRVLERLNILTWMYLSLDILGLLVVISRNI